MISWVKSTEGASYKPSSEQGGAWDWGFFHISQGGKSQPERDEGAAQQPPSLDGTEEGGGKQGFAMHGPDLEAVGPCFPSRSPEARWRVPIGTCSSGAAVVLCQEPCELSRVRI